MKCSNGDQHLDVGDSISVKLPGKAADIVLIVDTLKENEAVYKDFFQPMVAEITKTLQSKGIRSVQFRLSLSIYLANLSYFLVTFNFI